MLHQATTLRGHEVAQMTDDHRTIRELLEAAGFTYVKGWVYTPDAPKVRKMISEARAEVEEIKKDT